MKQYLLGAEGFKFSMSQFLNRKSSNGRWSGTALRLVETNFYGSLPSSYTLTCYKSCRIRIVSGIFVSDSEKPRAM